VVSRTLRLFPYLGEGSSHGFLDSLLAGDAGDPRASSIESQRHSRRADFDQWMKELSNWGRWGKDDVMGAVNLITPAKRQKALTSVKEGFSVSMAQKAETKPASDNSRPITGVMGGAGRGDQSGNLLTKAE
jgi:hypothetical protein